MLSNRKSRLLFYWPPFSPFFPGNDGCGTFFIGSSDMHDNELFELCEKNVDVVKLINKNTEIVLNMSHSTRRHNVLSSFFFAKSTN